MAIEDSRRIKPAVLSDQLRRHPQTAREMGALLRVLAWQAFLLDATSHGGARVPLEDRYRAAGERVAGVAPYVEAARRSLVRAAGIDENGADAVLARAGDRRTPLGQLCDRGEVPVVTDLDDPDLPDGVDARSLLWQATPVAGLAALHQDVGRAVEGLRGGAFAGNQTFLDIAAADLATAHAALGQVHTSLHRATVELAGHAPELAALSRLPLYVAGRHPQGTLAEMLTPAAGRAPRATRPVPPGLPVPPGPPSPVASSAPGHSPTTVRTRRV